MSVDMITEDPPSKSKVSLFLPPLGGREPGELYQHIHCKHQAMFRQDVILTYKTLLHQMYMPSDLIKSIRIEYIHRDEHLKVFANLVVDKHLCCSYRLQVLHFQRRFNMYINDAFVKRTEDFQKEAELPTQTVNVYFLLAIPAIVALLIWFGP
ncbi:uncharacterized protein LOC119683541 [Teleopsis dalmanni]|uniref:uncharacterized protein LOC119683541 n=1 Tax=Teleopsis dalmanni TaxID=139649 RepID=UPI0018CCA975|nr:uncharacterized protein LOC119683541 [Teleopsis dalmanni]